MEKEKKEKIGIFRFGVIATLTGLRKTSRGQKEGLLRDITSKEWDIPFSGRSYISRSTLLEWVRRYKGSGGKLESLYPAERSDTGRSRAIDKETEKVLVILRKELKNASLPVILKVARERKILPADFKASCQSIYRVFKRHGLDREEAKREDMRRFEAELPNDLWQSDCMHGPKVINEGKLKKTFLFDFIDDHSRIIPHAQFYFKENLENYMDCLKKALLKRGLPRKLYVDNGPCFRSHHLSHVTASCGIALIHCKAYRPEGKGKIERWHKTVRMQFLPILPDRINLLELNEKLMQWIDKEYHTNAHSVINKAPLERYLKHLHLIRQAPDNINDYFRKRVLRKVDKDRTVSLNSKTYEGPVELMGKTATLLYHEDDPGRIEIFFKDKSYGFLVPLNPLINSRIKRNKRIEIIPKEEPLKNEKYDSGLFYTGGKLFERSDDDSKL